MSPRFKQRCPRCKQLVIHRCLPDDLIDWDKIRSANDLLIWQGNEAGRVWREREERRERERLLKKRQRERERRKAKAN